MNEIAKTDTKEILPFFVADAVGPSGFENIENDCISIPFLRLAQSNTPQVSDPGERIDGLTSGLYFSPSTGKIYGASPKLIILGFYRSFTVWDGEPPKAKFVRALDSNDFSRNYQHKTHEQKKTTGKGTILVDDQGLRYTDTRNFFVLSADSPGDGVLLYAMTSSGIPASKKWLAKASMVRVQDADGGMAQAPIWSRIWEPKITYVNDNGGYYQVADIIDRGWISESMAPVVREAFEEVLAYDKARIAAVEKAEE